MLRIGENVCILNEPASFSRLFAGCLKLFEEMEKNADSRIVAKAVASFVPRTFCHLSDKVVSSTWTRIRTEMFRGWNGATNRDDVV